MDFEKDFKEKLLFIDENNFEKCALSLFEYQYHQNKVYNTYCNLLKRTPKKIHKIKEIPFLPIDFFKNNKIKCGIWSPKTVFLSSGTTQQQRSQNFVKDPQFYLKVSRYIFEQNYGDIEKYQILALLPNYIEQQNSSLIYMVDHFMKLSKYPSQYIDYKTDAVKNILENPLYPKILFGVSFALIEVLKKYKIHSKNTIIIETGGMKGRMKEITKPELYEIITNGYQPQAVHSEYGMTELFSQAYTQKSGYLKFPNWAKVLIREINDPFEYVKNDRVGGINIIDLANVDTCAFIETQDLGKKHNDEEFEILGRFDNSSLRGCNLLY